MSVDSGSVVNGGTPPKAKLKHGRSKATNHRDLLPHVADGRLSAARRFRDLVRALISDAGGEDNCSEVKLGLIRRLAAATVLSEELEGKAVNGEPVDINRFCQLASTGLRISCRLGLERLAKPVESLATYLERNYVKQSGPEEAMS